MLAVAWQMRMKVVFDAATLATVRRRRQRVPRPGFRTAVCPRQWTEILVRVAKRAESAGARCAFPLYLFVPRCQLILGHPRG
jgi:hypothetical protein